MRFLTTSALVLASATGLVAPAIAAEPTQSMGLRAPALVSAASRPGVNRKGTSAMTTSPAPAASTEEGSPADQAAVRAAMLDYALGWYAGDMARMRRALHPDLAKRAILPTESGQMAISEYRAEALIARVGKNTPERYAKDPQLSRVKLFAIRGNTATGMLEMDGWTDFMHLLKQDGQWKIINILWEPKED